MIDIHALVGAYAIDALDDTERAEFEQHLAECPACQVEVESLREAAALLAETTLITPSDELRSRVLAGIASLRPLPPITGAARDLKREAEPETDHETDHETVPAGATVSHLGSRRRRRLTTYLAAAAAVVVLGGGGGIVWQQVNDDPPSRTEQVLAASDAQRRTVAFEGGGRATVVQSAELNEAVIVTEDMPAPPSGHSFVLWLSHGGVMTPAGVMPPGPDNTVVLSGDAATADGAAVSVETADTELASPVGPIVASFTFDA